MIPETYTQKEIEEKISTLTNIEETLVAKRSQLTKDINTIRKQKEYWKELDKKQYKLFSENEL